MGVQRQRRHGLLYGFRRRRPNPAGPRGRNPGSSLGVSVKAFNERGESVVNEVGELVITEPMPSMPLRFWGDEGDRRYREAYFEEFPGVWRHGDFFRINERGSSFVLGRSDATLNRYGIRIGTAEVYRALALLEAIQDSLIVNIDLPDGGFFMPLFVELAPGVVLDERLQAEIRNRLRREYTPRHVPDRIYQVPAIPRTLTGKKMEVPGTPHPHGRSGGQGGQPCGDGRPTRPRLLRRIRSGAARLTTLGRP